MTERELPAPMISLIQKVAAIEANQQAADRRTQEYRDDVKASVASISREVSSLDAKIDETNRQIARTNAQIAMFTNQATGGVKAIKSLWWLGGITVAWVGYVTDQWKSLLTIFRH